MLGTFSLTYAMSTGLGVHEAATAKDAIVDHASLLNAGAQVIAIRDPKGKVVTIADLAKKTTAA